MVKNRKSIVVSDESINDYRCRLLNAGARTSSFLKNPVMLYMHERGRIVGKWENLRQEGDQWLADPVFDEGVPLGAELKGQWERGFLSAASLTASILAAVKNEALDCADVTDWEILEISMVDVGSNRNAVRLCAKDSPEVLDTISLTAHLSSHFSPIPPTSMDKNAIATACGLPATATDTEVTQKVLQLAAAHATQTDYKAKYDELVKSQESEQTARATTLLDAAVADHRISAEQKPSYLKLFAADFGAAETILAGLNKPGNLVNLAAQGQVAAAVQTQGQQPLDTAALAKEWDALERAPGTPLLSLKSGNFDRYKVLYKAKFGVDPTAA